MARTEKGQRPSRDVILKRTGKREGGTPGSWYLPLLANKRGKSSSDYFPEKKKCTMLCSRRAKKEGERKKSLGLSFFLKGGGGIEVSFI